MSSTDPFSSVDADQQSQTEKDALSDASIEIQIPRELAQKLQDLPGDLPTYIQQWIQQGYTREAAVLKRWQYLFSIKENVDQGLGKINYHWLLLLILWLGYGLLINSRDLYDYNLQQIGVEAIVERQHFYLEGSLSPDLQPRQDVFEYREHLYASKQPGQYLLGAIAYFFLHHLAGMRYVGSYDLTSAWVTFLTASTVTTFATAAVFLLARQWSTKSRYPFWPYLCAASFAIASTAFPYAGIAHHDALATSFLIMGAYFIFSVDPACNHENLDSRESLIDRIYSILGGVCLGLTITTSMLPFFMVIPLFIYFIVNHTKKIILFLVGCFIGVFSLLFYNTVSFGNPFLLPNIAGQYTDTFFHLDWENFWSKVSFYRSQLLQYTPISGLGLFGLCLLPQKQWKEKLTLASMAIFFSGYILNIETIGHCMYGPRYLLPWMPFAALGIVGYQFVQPFFLKFLASVLLVTAFCFSVTVNLIGALSGTMNCDLTSPLYVGFLGKMISGEFIHFPLVKYLGIPFLICSMILFAKLSSSALDLMAQGEVKARCQDIQDRLQATPINPMAVHISTSIFVGLVYYLFIPIKTLPQDYTFLMASELLQGQIGTSTPPPGWLSEYVFREGRYYFVFPLGSILTMLPVTLLDRLGMLSGPSSVLIASLIATGLSFFGFLLAQAYRFSLGMQVVLVLFLTLGNWIWCNLVFGYADMLTLGWSALGQLGSLYFILVRKKPLISGLLFALAMGNRTEVVVLTPIFIALWFISETDAKRRAVSLYRFCLFPVLILILTFWHNYIRFDSIFEFGKGLVAGAFEQPHFADGLYSMTAMADHFTQMLTATWKRIDHFPFIVPSGFGGSIFLASPFLVLIFRLKPMKQPIVILCWIAMIVMTLTMWLYGDVGGWQFSYRYAVNLLPWIYILLLHCAPRQINVVVVFLLLISLLINCYAVWLFHWTSYLS